MLTMLKERQKEIILGAILVAIAFVLWQNLGGGSGTAGGAAPAGAGPRVDLPGIQKMMPKVDWAALSAPRPAYDPSGRNIFQFGAIPPPPPPVLTAQEKAAIAAAQAAAEAERKRQEELMRQQQEAAAAAAQAEQTRIANLPPPPPPKPQPPAINYKFIGYVGPSESKIAVLHDGTDLIFVRQGEKIGGQFKILEIGYESIKFGYTDPRFKGETTTLPMSSSY
ncbi:MAG TPA: hypothetical protein VGV60_15140 [Candidatus Polarisedimenticolia bacterium]|jgi:hypothetical protein|nr:hypothetical protein [Candidatus Polarisedimenticolia bacterium]